MKKLIFICAVVLAFFFKALAADIVSVGHGSYTTAFPGYDSAGRNSYPSGTPYLSGNALGKPVPTSDWWSTLVKEGAAANLFNYPFTLKTLPAGMLVSYIPFGVIDDLTPFVVGVRDMNAPTVTVSDYSDWTVTVNWNDGSHHFELTAGVGMPFLYFTKQSSDLAQITINSGTVVIENEMLIATNVKNGADFAVYAPSGSTWTQNGSVYTSTLNGKNYWSMAFIPLTASNVAAVAREYKKYAYVFPVKTTAAYAYDDATSVLRTDFNVETEVKEGSETDMLLGLLPHQWANLAADSPVPGGYSYAVIRGEMKTLAGNHFSVENKFHGILPTLPYVDTYSRGFVAADLENKITSLEDTEMALWTDSYNEGQVFNQLMQTARIANETGDIQARDKMLNTIRTRLENWLKAESGETAFLFYYNRDWNSMIGYPAGYGQDSGLNDKQFHWGYFIQAAAFVAQFTPGWAGQWGAMVDMLVRDAAAFDRNDNMFPYLRNFSPYEGHSWVDGFANNPQGNNQESSSESMLFNAAVIQWGLISGNKDIRDLGIYLYTTEQTGIEEYYMDIHHRNFPASQQYSLVSRVWSNSFDNGTFWTGDIAASYGIELYPVQGGSFYLTHDTVYVKRLWNEIAQNTGILSNQVNPNLWHDTMWKYLAFIDPAKAIEMYNSFPGRDLKFGMSDALTYHWLHALNVLGKVDAGVTADYPLAVAFIKNGQRNYAAQNYASEEITVTFSTGYTLHVPAGQMATSIGSDLTGTIASSFPIAYPGGSVGLHVTVPESVPSKVEFLDGDLVIATVADAPFECRASELTTGVHAFSARLYDGDQYSLTNTVQVFAGDRFAYENITPSLPGTVYAGRYDAFEGGKGQNICYHDVNSINSGDFRTAEAVDAFTDENEGAVVESVAAGEWLEYTVDVAQTGLYSMTFRYASGNASGGGPFHLEVDGNPVSADITVPAAGTNSWDTWSSQTVGNIPLYAGRQTLRVVFDAGGFNLGKMTFVRTGDISFSHPVADAGNNFKVFLPAVSAALNGSASTESSGKSLTYQWSQVYGPSIATITDDFAAETPVANLTGGMYCFRLKVTNPDGRTDEDQVLLLVTEKDNESPRVSLIAPETGGLHQEGEVLTLRAKVSDFENDIAKVEFYRNDVLISDAVSEPYTAQWMLTEGSYALTAKVTDGKGATAVSSPVNIAVENQMACTTVSSVASQGSFSEGYRCTYETVGTDVTVTFELYDNKPGLIAYLWKQSPFSEMQMTQSGAKTFTATISQPAYGSTLNYACKFAFEGGMAVTEYISYVVGSNCVRTATEEVVKNSRLFYPNPVRDRLYLAPDAEISQVRIFDLMGRKVFEEIVLSGSDPDLSRLSPGTYVLELESTTGIRREKLLKK